MVFNATFNNILVISSVILVEGGHYQVEGQGNGV